MVLEKWYCLISAGIGILQILDSCRGLWVAANSVMIFKHDDNMRAFIISIRVVAVDSV